VTIILALRHSEGFAMASDSQATQFASGQPVRLDSGDKLHLLERGIAWGATGHEGTIQQVKAALDAKASVIYKEFKNSTNEKGAQLLHSFLLPVQQATMKRYIKEMDPQGQEAPIIGAIVCGYGREGPFLIECNKAGGWQFHHRPFFAVGSADVFALYAMTSVLHYRVETLTEKQALALAYRTVSSAIESAAFGIGGEVQMIKINREKAARLERPELESLKDTVTIWKQKEVEALGGLSASSIGENAPELKDALVTTEPLPKEA
jgi:20S proteasome alpha/beta subunit